MPTVDRQARNRLVLAIEQYLVEQITAFQFADETSEIRSATDDPTVKCVVDDLWHYYDDCKDHKVIANKQVWDYFQRLLLLLKSDGHVEIETTRRWYPSQIVAVIALIMFGVVFAACVATIGFGEHLLLLSVPFGPVSMLLAWWRRRLAPTLTPLEIAVVPFASVAELLQARRRQPFTKLRYPPHLQQRTIRTPTMDRILRFQSYIMWCLFSPLVLLCQAFPGRDTRTRVAVR